MTNYLSLVLVLLSAAVCADAQTAPLPVAKNLIFEGNFVEHSGGVPEGWAPGGFAGGDHGNSTKVTEDREGNYVTLIVPGAPAAHYTLTLKEHVTLRPTWKALLCSVDVRVFNYEQGKESYYKPRMHVTFVDQSGKDMSSVGVSLSSRYTDAWQTAEKEIPIPSGASAAKIWLGTFGATGQLEFRNPYIAPVE